MSAAVQRAWALHRPTPRPCAGCGEMIPPCEIEGQAGDRIHRVERFDVSGYPYEEFCGPVLPATTTTEGKGVAA